VIPRDDRFPDRIEAGLMPGGVVVRLHRWSDAALLRERRLNSAEAIEAIAGLDSDETFTDDAAIPGRETRALVMCGYDGDDGAAMIPPALITDDPDLIAELGGGPGT
jgi:hypothetical protein